MAKSALIVTIATLIYTVHKGAETNQKFEEIDRNPNIPSEQKDARKILALLDGGTGVTVVGAPSNVASGLSNVVNGNAATIAAAKQALDNAPHKAPTDPNDYAQALGKFIDGLEVILGIMADYQWAALNPDDMYKEFMPPWLQDLLAPIFNTPGANPTLSMGGGDPLVLDLNGDGQVNLTSVENGVYYDFWQDGFKEKTGWVAAGDGMLVFDKDKDGLIEGYQEMIATQTPLSYLIEDDWDAFANEEHGFAQLGKFDTNKDGIVDVNDAAFKDLKVWQDTNQDGVNQSGELKTLSQLGIKSIDYASAELDSFYGLINGGFHRRIEGNITHKSV